MPAYTSAYASYKRCYLDVIPKDIRNLLFHYTHRDNWDIFKDILDDIAYLGGEGIINEISQKYNLHSRAREHHTDVVVYASIEDVITDEILEDTINRFVPILRITGCCDCDEVDDYNSRLAAIGSRLRI